MSLKPYLSALAMKYDGPGLDKLGDIKYKTARYSNGVAAHTLYLHREPQGRGQGLDFGFEYQTGRGDAGEAGVYLLLPVQNHIPGCGRPGAPGRGNHRDGVKQQNS